MKFKKKLHKKIKENFFNDYGIENYDGDRFGIYEGKKIYNYKDKIKNLVKNLFDPRLKIEIEAIINSKEKYLQKLEFIYHHLDDESQKILIEVVAFRLLGYKKIKLSRNNAQYWKALKIAESLVIGNDTLDPKFMHFILHKMDLTKIGFPIQFYFSPSLVNIDFIQEQYALKRKNNYLIQADKNDVVLDIGGCWGDTALYFACKVGEEGKVYSFEFIPGNIDIHKLNQSFNEHLQKQIQIIDKPVFNKSGKDVFYKDFGPGSRIEFEPFEGLSGQTKTITIDDFVSHSDIKRIDFIKMDIEGAEPYALEGAIETIKKFKPKLAIAIYHSWEDFVNIPIWILDLNLGYEIYMDHYTIHAEETVVYAKIKE